jgi:hypothetical protein
MGWRDRMPLRDDYTLSIEEVSKRLNKSIRTIHRYKDSGRLSFIVGTSQGNPLFFSRSEVDSLAYELYPNLAPAAVEPNVDPLFWDRLQRVERLLAIMEANPAFEQMLAQVDHGKPTQELRIEETLSELLRLENGKQKVDNKALGQLLNKLSHLLLGDVTK